MKTYYILVIFLLVLVAFGDAGKGKNKKGKDRKRKKDRKDKCEQITVPACLQTHLPYNNTRLPNLFGHSSQDEVNEGLNEYMPLMKASCSPYISYFLCSAFLPECPRKKKMKTPQPCKELCIKAKEGCEGVLDDVFGDGWPADLDCDQFPRQSESKKEKKKKSSCFYYEPVLPTIMVPPPEILEEPESITILVGEIIELMCRATSDKPLQFSWSKIDGELPMERLQEEGVEHGSKLRILDTEDSDSGTYVCTISYPGGSIEAVADVDVEMPPSFVRRPQDTTVAVGNTARLQCEASGYPAPTISWYKDGALLPPERSVMKDNMLVLMNAQLDDAGRYQCYAWNSAGYVNVSAILSVFEMPRFVESPMDTSAPEESNVTFTCVVTGLPQPVVTWSKSRGELPEGRTLITNHGSILHLLDIETGDVGIYSCTAVNSIGAISSQVQLEVQVKPRIYSIDPPRFVAEIGEDALFMCQFSGFPTPTVFWNRKGSNNLMFPGKEGSDRYQITDDGALIIANIREDDDGIYVCGVLNTVGSVEMESRLEVVAAGTKSAKEFPLEYMTTVVGSNVTLDCLAVGDSQPMVEWQVQNMPTKLDLKQNNATYQMNKDGGLVIYNTTTMHSGTYICKAVHVWGTRYSTVSLQVEHSTTRHTTDAMMTSTPMPMDATTQMTTKSKTEDMMTTPESTPTVVMTSMTMNMTSDEMGMTTVPACTPCEERAGTGTIHRRRYDITDPGLEGYFRGWVDVQGQGAANDFCRVVPAEDFGFQLACALAGTEGADEYNYKSSADLDVGFEGTWYMKDEDGDGRDDYCRCAGEGNKAYVWCMKAGVNGFYGENPNDAASGSQYSFKAAGKKKELKQCEGRIVDPFLGIVDEGLY
ncbi:roundabout homolog 2-like [Glandiceps talaboti]